MLRACPQLTHAQAERIGRQCIANLMFRMLDDLLPCTPAAQRLNCIEIVGREHLERAISAGKGVVLLTGHFFASRIALRHLARIGYPVLCVKNQNPGSQLEGRLGRRLLRPRSIVKVDPAEVEKTIATLSWVPECHVDAVAGSGGSEVIRARIAVYSGAPCERREVIERCREHLAEYKLPRIIEFLESSPLAITGKMPAQWQGDEQV